MKTLTITAVLFPLVLILLSSIAGNLIDMKEGKSTMKSTVNIYKLHNCNYIDYQYVMLDNSQKFGCSLD